MDTVAPPRPESIPVCDRWLPITDIDSGITCLMLESTVRHFGAVGGGPLTLRFRLPPVPDAPIATQPRTDTGTRYSEPRTLAQWALAFDVHEKTLGRWFRTGQVDAKRQGKFWRVAERDVPRSDTR